MKEKRFGFEEVTYLLLYGMLPTENQLGKFNRNSFGIPYSADKFRPGRHYESAYRRHDEYAVPQRAHVICL
jgi:hypothetical protein